MTISISDARARLLLKRPYYASILMRLRPVQKPGLGTFGVLPDLTLWYDPEVPWDLKQATAVLEHEINHIIRDHAGRKMGRDHMGWNVACDAEINDGGIADLPPGCVTPQSIGCPVDLSAEQYYDKLPKLNVQVQGCGSPGCTGKDGNGNDLPDKQGGQPGQDPVGTISGVEMDAIRKGIAEDVGKNPGNAPNSLKRWAEVTLRIKPIPWDHLLKRSLSNTVARSAVATLCRYPGRRPSLGRFLFPRWRGTRPTVAAVIDTSGSINDHDLAIAIKVVKDMSEHADPIVFSCDTEAHRVKRLEKGALIGGGGTDMGAGIKAAIDAGDGRLAAIVIVTDCYTPWPSKSPGVPVIIITTNGSTEVPVWTKRILINAT